MKKGDVLEAKAVDYTIEGWSVVKPDGFPLFVNGLLKNETAEVEITKLNKSYGFAKTIRIKESSEERITPVCPIAEQCGGCQFQHIAYFEQLRIKEELLRKALNYNDKRDYQIEEIVGMKEPLRYRNKMQIPINIDKEGKLHSGFYRNNSHSIVDTDYCYLQSDKCNEVYKAIKELLVKYAFAKEVRHILLRESHGYKEIMVVLIVRTFKLKKIEHFVENLIAKEYPIVGVQLILNDRNDNVILGEEVKLLYGSEYIKDSLLNNEFLISAKAFYQINSLQCAKLYKKALELAELKKSTTVLDLYCGSGTIGILAAKKVKRVIGVEILKEAIDDARLNATLNRVENIEFYCGDAGEIAKTLKEKIDVIFVDPPRKGLSDLTKSAIKTLDPQRIVYISCNPMTLSRDLNDFGDTYQIGVLYPFDMFPYTKHIETVTVLKRCQPK